MAKRLVGQGRLVSNGGTKQLVDESGAPFPPAPAGKMHLQERAHAEDRSQGFLVYEVDVCPECEGSGCKLCKWEGVFEGEVPHWAAARRPEVYVSCCFCGKDLTDALSQERGYGPVCAGKYGMLFDTTAPQVDDLLERMTNMALVTSSERRHVADDAASCYQQDKKLAAKRLAYLLSFVTSNEETDAQLRALEGLGFRSMAGLIACERGSVAVQQASKRKCEVSLIDTRYGRQIAVRTPCKPKGDGMERERELPGRRWDPKLRVVRYPVTSWDAVAEWVLAYFPLSELPERPDAEIAAALEVEKAKPPKQKEVVRLSLLSKRIAIESPYNRNFVEQVRGEPGRVWMCLECGKRAKPKCEDHPKGTHVWAVPLDRADRIKALVKEHYPNADHFVSPQLAEALAAEDKKMQAAHSPVAPVVDLPGGQLYPFQGSGVRYLEAANGNAIIADEQGLGKTVQAIAYVSRNINVKRGEMVLYVVPANVKYNWASEILHWLAGTELNDTKLLRRIRREGCVRINDVEVSVLSGRPKKDGTLPLKSGHPVAQHVIVNYDILSAWKELLMAPGYSVVIADEAQNLKNQKAARTKAFEEIVENVTRRVFLTGTPVLNRPKDLWNLLRMIDEETWGNFFQFHQRYTNAQQKWAGRSQGFVWDFSGASNTEELHDRLDGHQWVRRLKSEVLAELPEKQRHIVSLDIPDKDRRIYERVERECAKMMPMGGGKLMAAKDMDGGQRQMVLAQITRLRVAAGAAKVAATCSWLEDLVESVGKVVVFAHHQHMVEALVEHFDALKIDGSVSAAQRAEAVAQFQSDPKVRVIVCSIQAASVGITLTAASHVVLTERVWRAKDHDQAEDRIHRIGQDKQVTAWYLDVPETFDEAMRAINDWKAKVADQIVDGVGVDGEDRSLQLALDYLTRQD
jgi:SWI/SNF-related matrix-associated actin-dependent regulator 1 of chromatin subfamily A